MSSILFLLTSIAPLFLFRRHRRRFTAESLTAGPPTAGSTVAGATDTADIPPTPPRAAISTASPASPEEAREARAAVEEARVASLAAVATTTDSSDYTWVGEHTDTPIRNQAPVVPVALPQAVSLASLDQSLENLYKCGKSGSGDYYSSSTSAKRIAPC